MARLMIGNSIGVTAVGNLKTPQTLLASVTADGANTVTVDSIENLRPGMVVDIVNKSTGAELAVDRTITNITDARVVTYNGADVAATTAHGLYLADGYAPVDNRSNINGGKSLGAGFDHDPMYTIDDARRRLKVIDAAYYTDAQLDKLTYNDLIYALRIHDAPSTIK